MNARAGNLAVEIDHGVIALYNYTSQAKQVRTFLVTTLFSSKGAGKTLILQALYSVIAKMLRFAIRIGEKNCILP